MGLWWLVHGATSVAARWLFGGLKFNMGFWCALSIRVLGPVRDSNVLVPKVLNLTHHSVGGPRRHLLMSPLPMLHLATARLLQLLLQML